MPDEKKKDLLHAGYWRETFFLPPLKMVLAFFDKQSYEREKKKGDAQKQEKTVEKNVEKLIEKLSEKDK